MRAFTLGIVLCAMALATPAVAAITIVHSAENDVNDSTNNVAVTITSTTAGNLMVVGCGSHDATRTTTAAGGGADTLTQAASSPALDTGVGQVDVWYKLSGAGGITSYSCTFSSATGTRKFIMVYEVNGFTTAALDVVGATSNGSGSAQVSSGPSVTTTSTTGFIIGIITSSQNIDQNPLTGNEFTSGGLAGSTTDLDTVTLISTTAAAHQPQWHTTSTASFGAATVAFKESGGGGSVFPHSGMLLRGVE